MVPNKESFRDIPLIESHNGRFTVKYENIKSMMENYGYELEDTVGRILESNGINADSIEISISESDAISNIEDIGILNEYGINYKVYPISDRDIISIYTDYMVEEYINSGNENYISLLESPELLLEADDDEDYTYDRKNLNLSYKDKKGYWSLNHDYGEGKATGWYKDPKTGAYNKSDKPVDVTDANFLIKIKRFLTDKPRDTLAKIAARLRETYRKWLLKANQEHDQNKIKWYKQIARRIMQAVDWILQKIEGVKVNYMKRFEKGLQDKFGGQKNLRSITVYHNRLKNSSVDKNEMPKSAYETHWDVEKNGEIVPTSNTVGKIARDLYQRTTEKGRQENQRKINDYYRNK